MSTPETITSELQKLEPSAVIELFELDVTPLGGVLYRFHAGTNELKTDLIWQGNVYTRYPVQVTGFEISAQGSLPRPKLRVSNMLSAITALLLDHEDLIGAILYRKRTLKKYLDADNFDGGNPTADPDASFADDKYFVDRKSSENRDAVEFELAASFDLAGIQLPRRQIVQNICVWKYRGGECGYSDTRYFLANDNETSDPNLDVCGKRLTSCKARFGSGGDLPFGGFPGASLKR